MTDAQFSSSFSHFGKKGLLLVAEWLVEIRNERGQ